MATCQGETYLQQQLDSIEQQRYRHWMLHVSDDASSDKTLEIVEAFKLRCEQAHAHAHEKNSGLLKEPLAFGQVHLHTGPQKGPTENFMHLVRLLGGAQCFKTNDLVAFADQDDVWLPEKLERAVAWHLNERARHASANTHPMLYAAKSYLVDEALGPMGLSKSPKGPLVFNAALVENVLSGNTMVMNKALIDILKLMHVSNAVWHDWSAYLVATACQGALHYDEAPCVLYRQHDKNVIGVRTGFVQQCFRARAVLQGRYKAWAEVNLLGLKDIEASLSAQSAQLLHLYERVRLEKSAMRRLLMLRHLSIRRQNPLLQFFLYLGLLLGWV